jgi:Fic family protein
MKEPHPNHIKYLHGLLLKHTEKDEYHRGHYKKFPNHVEAFDPNGRSLGIIFSTTKPFDTPRLMEELIDWTRQSLEKKTYHPLLIIGVQFQ